MIELNMAFVIQIINFGILAIALNIVLYRPIRRVMAERREAIESSRARAESVDREVREQMARYEAKLQDARTEAAQRRNEAVRQAQAEEAALLEKARNDAAASLVGIRESVARESAEAGALLRKQAQALAGDVCEKILGRSL